MFGHILFTSLVKSAQEFIECSFLSYPHLFFQTKLPTTDRIFADAIDVRQALNAHVNLDQTTEVNVLFDFDKLNT